MDIDWIIALSAALAIGGGVALLAGLIATARPIARMGLGSRRRALFLAAAGLGVTCCGIALAGTRCDPTLACGHCALLRTPLDESSCLPSVRPELYRRDQDGPAG